MLFLYKTRNLCYLETLLRSKDSISHNHLYQDGSRDPCSDLFGSYELSFFRLASCTLCNWLFKMLWLEILLKDLLSKLLIFKCASTFLIGSWCMDFCIFTFCRNVINFQQISLVLVLLRDNSLYCAIPRLQQILSKLDKLPMTFALKYGRHVKMYP